MAIAGEIPPELVDWWDDYARSLRRRDRSDATARVYRQSYERFWTWALTQGLPPDPAAVSTAMINRWVDSVRDTVAPATVRIYWQNLRPFFSWWAKETDQPNPFKGADSPSPALSPPDVIHLDDIRALLAASNGKDFASRRDHAVIRVLFDTGCRRGELVNLRLEDWDRRQDFLTLRGKTGMRVVPISASTGEALARYLRARSSHPAATKSDALWLGGKGPLRDSGVFRVQGGSDVDLMYLAGWSSTAMAARYGSSAAAQRAREAHRRLGLGDKL